MFNTIIALFTALLLGYICGHLSVYFKIYDHIWLKVKNVAEKHFFTIWICFMGFMLFPCMILFTVDVVNNFYSYTIMTSIWGLGMLFYPAKQFNLRAYLITYTPFVFFLIQSNT